MRGAEKARRSTAAGFGLMMQPGGGTASIDPTTSRSSVFGV